MSPRTPEGHAAGGAQPAAEKRGRRRLDRQLVEGEPAPRVYPVHPCDTGTPAVAYDTAPSSRLDRLCFAGCYLAQEQRGWPGELVVDRLGGWLVQHHVASLREMQPIYIAYDNLLTRGR